MKNPFKKTKPSLDLNGVEKNSIFELKFDSGTVLLSERWILNSIAIQDYLHLNWYKLFEEPNMVELPLINRIVAEATNVHEVTVNSARKEFETRLWEKISEIKQKITIEKNDIERNS